MKPENAGKSGAVASGFVGRERELAALERGLERALHGRGSVFLLLGEPGIGKTRLADELSARAAHSGARVLWGRCWEGGGAPAFWPWVQVLRVIVREADGKEIPGRFDPSAIAVLLPELRERTPEDASGFDLDSDDARFALFDAVTNLLRNLARRAPLVIVLDDLHAADVPSLLLLRFIARESRGMPLLVLATCRDAEARAQPEAARVLDEILRDADHFVLGGLAEAEVGELIAAAFAIRPAGTVLPAISALTEGNPFFVDEVVRLVLAENGGRAPDAAAWARIRVPDRVREVIRRRLFPLSAASRQLLSVAAVIGRDFDLRTLEGASGLERTKLLSLLDDARGCATVRESPDRFGFVHSLIREILYEELPASERAGIHREIGLFLEGLPAHEREARLGELAHHFFEAIPAGETERAIRHARRAGDEAMALLAYEESVAHYQRALRAATQREGFPDSERCELLLSLGQAQWRIRDVTGALQTFSEAAALSRQLGDRGLLARSALGLAGESVRFLWPDFGIADPFRIGLLREALTAMPSAEDSLRVRLLSLLSIELHYDASAQIERLALAREAASLARRLGDPKALIAALRSQATAASGPEAADERMQLGNEIVRIAQECGFVDHALPGHVFRMRAHLERGEVSEADRTLETCARLVSTRHPFYSWWTDVYRAMRAVMKGSFDEGERLARRALETYEQLWPEHAQQVFLGHLGPVLRWRGGLEGIATAVEDLTRQLHERSASAVSRAGLAVISAENGRLEQARRELDELSRNDFADVPRDELWLAALTFLADVCVAVGDVARAGTLRELLSPFGERLPTTGAACWSPVSQALGDLSLVLGDEEAAIGYLEQTVRTSERIDAPPFAVRARISLAQARLGRKPSGSA